MTASLSLAAFLDAAKRDEIDLRSTPIRVILQDSFDSQLSLETRAENVWLAASLIQLKLSRLLPAPPCPAPDSSERLIPTITFDPGQLHQATSFLQSRLGAAVLSAPGVEDIDEEPSQHEAPGLSLFDILRLARQAVETAHTYQELSAASPEAVRIEEMFRIVEEALATSPDVFQLDALLESQVGQANRVSLFLAVLELTRLARIRLDQADTFAPITLYRPT